jgi:succinoglycan biosynthesis protein ExoM
MGTDTSKWKAHICVCICTFKRPRSLRILLEKIGTQATSGLFTHSVNIVDNDKDRSAARIIDQFRSTSQIPIRYQVEPRQNISLARNMVVATAQGDYFAFIDDDEFPIETWLISFYEAMQEYQVAGVLGPVLPYFDKQTPPWLIKSGICIRPSIPTGTFLTFENTRTGNVMLDSQIFKGMATPFEPQQGRRGGEDIAFFRKVIDKGHKFVWCEKAPVYEIVGPERWTKTYYIKRSALNGGNSGQLIPKDHPSSWLSVFRSGLSIPVFLLLLPFSLLIGRHVFMRYLCRMSYHLSRVFSFFGFVLIKERNP